MVNWKSMIGHIITQSAMIIFVSLATIILKLSDADAHTSTLPKGIPYDDGGVNNQMDSTLVPVTVDWLDGNNNLNNGSKSVIINDVPLVPSHDIDLNNQSLSTSSSSLLSNLTVHNSSNIPITVITSTASSVNTNSNNHNNFVQNSTNQTVKNEENRFRWVDFRRQQYPPRVPNVPGIPSGFRNPLVEGTGVVNAPVASNEPVGSMYNPGTHHNFYSGSSSNPLSFGGSVIMDDVEPFKAPNPNRRYNITRVEHIVAECSDDYMKVLVRFNGTFTGLIYSSGYVYDESCIYVNGSGRSFYEFYIRLNQCGTLGRQEMYHPTMPGEARRRDQLMWNTLSIQYNALIEEEFDEHFRLTCEYGSDFWKTVTFPSVNVEINTGSPVIFTINPPQCQMEIRRGFGTAGTRTSGPVTVGDPLTLLIHMKSEKAGFDILVKNCIAHNGAQQRMLLIDNSGCVTNEKLISPFRGTYNSESGHQVSLYSYLKAFRFTGSPALYLECDIHMCHNRCPPQRCYWRNLAKRSTEEDTYDDMFNSTDNSILSESISLFQALEVHHEQDEDSKAESIELKNQANTLICLKREGLMLITIVFVCLMSFSLGTSICFCLRMRRVKHFHRNISALDHIGTNKASLRSALSTTSDYSTDSSRFFRFR